MGIVDGKVFAIRHSTAITFEVGRLIEAVCTIGNLPRRPPRRGRPKK